MEITWDVIDSHAYQFRNIGVGADTDVVVLGDHSLQPSLRDVARLALQSIGASVVEVLSTSALNQANGDRNIATELVSSSAASSDYVIDCTKSKLTQNLDLDSIQRSGTQIIIEDKNTQCVQPLGATRLCASRCLPSIAASVPWWTPLIPLASWRSSGSTALSARSATPLR